MSFPIYVLITPAWNEAEFIECTLKSVVAQSIRPAKWVIVSDGSTDGTDDIVRKYTSEHSWIELIRMPERRERNFAGKVNAFNAGHKSVSGLPYQVIGSLDADVSFDEQYFAFLLQKLAENPLLGLVGTPFEEAAAQRYDYHFVSLEHVSGICQLFRRECFEAIGGYKPVEGGGIDLIAVVSARMKGWQTRTFTEKVSVHHRVMGTAQAGSLSVWYKTGRKDYTFGCHPVWELFRIIYQMTRKPYIFRGLLLAWGYMSGFVRGAARPVTSEWIAFRRREQMQRLKKFVFRRTSSGPKPKMASRKVRQGFTNQD